MVRVFLQEPLCPRDNWRTGSGRENGARRKAWKDVAARAEQLTDTDYVPGTGIGPTG